MSFCGAAVAIIEGRAGQGWTGLDLTAVLQPFSPALPPALAGLGGAGPARAGFAFFFRPALQGQPCPALPGLAFLFFQAGPACRF